MKNAYVYNTQTNIIDRIDNSGLLNENEAFIYDDNYYSLRHESQARLYKVVNEQITARTEQEIESDPIYEAWYVEKNIIPDLKINFLEAYGSYGGLGSLIADARGRLGNADSDTFIDELRNADNYVDLAASSNIAYSDKNLTENEKGFYYVIDPTQDAILTTYSLYEGEKVINFETFYICLVGVILEYGYKISDITLEYRKGSGTWQTATPLGKAPYSVFSKVVLSGTGAIQLRLTLKTGNNDTTKHAGIVSFAVVGI